jgi:proteasome lid subunit RPN8/RPN11
MTTDDSLDIQFGEVEETRPEVRLRPDANKHFAVAAVYSPREGELPIFVDIDAMRDMEEHALSDTSVELGGVMLGGQYEDEDGRPFVLVTDSLRAQHYESTKGSFKFTHDTWAQITREREEFPEELQMVGWYHTHPDWSVFLSGMDMFICNNFFNKKLDVALVIDPCRQDRGFFQWAEDAAAGTLRTGGFHLIASRFRQFELEEYATYLEGLFAMAGDPRFRGTSSGQAPIVNVGSQQPWQGVAVLGLLAMQFCFLMLLSWKLLIPGETPDDKPPQEVVALQRSVQQLADAQRRNAEIDSKIEVLDRVIGEWDGSPAPLVDSLVERTTEASELRDSVRAHKALELQLDAKLTELNRQLQDAENREASVRKMLKIRESIGKKQKLAIDKLENELAELKPQDDDAAETKEVGAEGEGRKWKWVVGGVVAVLTALALASLLIPKPEADLGEEEVKESKD